MIPIQDLLNRIRWDQGFASAEFRVGYYDRVERRIVRVPLRPAELELADHFSIELQAPDRELHRVPLHRIVEVYREDVLIWRREPPPHVGSGHKRPKRRHPNAS